MKHNRIDIVVSLLLFVLSLHGISAQAVVVEVTEREGQWTFLRNGEEYYVKGVGGHHHLDKAVEIGANSIRTWGVDNAGEVLDEAHKRGLTVMLGFWVQHERHGFDYDDTIAVQQQIEGFRKAVLLYKDHPALLLWGIGNEVNLSYKNTNVWYTIQAMAKIAHELDPHHPTTTVTAGLAEREARLIRERCPDIDVLSVNTYGDIVAVPDNIRKYKWEKAYMITEWGPNGHWEVDKSPWGAPFEQTSAEKATTYRERYQNYIAADSDRCIGSYVFLWGQKQEKTSTWYGMFSPDGKSSQGVDELHKLWQNSDPENSAPIIENLKLDFGTEAKYLKADDLVSVSAEATDPDGDKLSYVWQVTPESLVKSEGGDVESSINSVPGTIKKKKGNTCKLRVPKKTGPYRIVVFIHDGKGHYATANIPFFSNPPAEGEPQSRFAQFKTKKLEIPELKTNKSGR